MTGAEFAALFDRAERSAFRLETLPSYDVGGGEAADFAAWRDGRPRPVRSVVSDEYLAEVATTTLTGRRWERVRLVDDPLTEYERFQLDSYRDAQAAGEHIWIAPRGAAPLPCDFWLFDAGMPTAAGVILRYTNDGRPERYERPNAHELDALEQLRTMALRVARPLNEYLADRAVAAWQAI